MKFMNKLFSIILVFTCGFISFSLFSVDVKASTYDDFLISYQSDKMWQDYYAVDPDAALAIVERAVEIEIQNNRINLLRGGTPTNATVLVPTIKQTQNYNCGPTSALQALYGANLAGSVSGGTNAEKISKLEKDMNTTDDTLVINVTTGLNKYITSNQYAYIMAGSTGLLSSSTLGDKLFNSVYKDRAPILHAATSYLGYYNGTSMGHYITVQSVNKIANYGVVLNDCNNNTSYNGVFSAPLSEVWNAIYDPQNIRAIGRRYLIYA